MNIEQEILKSLQARLKSLNGMIGAEGNSKRSSMKLRVRADEVSKAIGMVQNHITIQEAALEAQYKESLEQ